MGSRLFSLGRYQGASEPPIMGGHRQRLPVTHAPGIDVHELVRLIEADTPALQ